MINSLKRYTLRFLGDLRNVQSRRDEDPNGEWVLASDAIHVIEGLEASLRREQIEVQNEHYRMADSSRRNTAYLRSAWEQSVSASAAVSEELTRAAALNNILIKLLQEIVKTDVIKQKAYSSQAGGRYEEAEYYRGLNEEIEHAVSPTARQMLDRAIIVEKLPPDVVIAAISGGKVAVIVNSPQSQGKD